MNSSYANFPPVYLFLPPEKTRAPVYIQALKKTSEDLKMMQDVVHHTILTNSTNTPDIVSTPNFVVEVTKQGASSSLKMRPVTVRARRRATSSPSMRHYMTI